MTNQEHQTSDDYEEFDDNQKSKTQVKKEFAEHQQFIIHLLETTNSQLNALTLDDDLRQEIKAARQLTKSARKREIKFLAKQLRQYDIESLQQQYEQLQKPQQQEIRHFHRLEHWRDQLLSEDKVIVDKTLEELVDDYQCDRQKLRQLMLKARQEIKKNLPPAAKREIFRYLSAIIQADKTEESI